MHNGLSSGMNNVLSVELTKKLKSLNGAYKSCLEVFVFCYAHEFGLSDSAATEMQRDVGSRLGFTSIAQAVYDI